MSLLTINQHPCTVSTSKSNSTQMEPPRSKDLPPTAFLYTHLEVSQSNGHPPVLEPTQTVLFAIQSHLSGRRPTIRTLSQPLQKRNLHRQPFTSGSKQSTIGITTKRSKPSIPISPRPFVVSRYDSGNILSSSIKPDIGLHCTQTSGILSISSAKPPATNSSMTTTSFLQFNHLCYLYPASPTSATDIPC